MASIFDNETRLTGMNGYSGIQKTSHTNTTPGTEFKNKGAMLRTQMTAEEKAVEGSKSDTVKFLTCLANPAKKQSRQDSHMHTDIPCYEVVGYKFKLLDDARVPVANYKVGAKTFLDVEQPVKWEDRKAGEEIVLNIFETGLFVSQPCYAGQISGEGIVVNLIAKTSKKRVEPRPALRRDGGQGSIKTDMEFVAELIQPTDGRRPYAVVKEEYKEKFGNLFTQSTVTRVSGKADADKQVHKEVAAAYLNYYKNYLDESAENKE